MFIIFDYTRKIRKAMIMEKKKQARQAKKEEMAKKEETKKKNTDFPKDMEQLEKYLKEYFHESSDVIILPIQTKKEKAIILFIDGLVNTDLVDRDILKPLLDDNFTGDVLNSITVNQKEAVTDLIEAIDKVLNGNTAIFYTQSPEIICADIRGWDKRGIETPDSESSIRGSKEGFTETLRTNTAMLRRRIKSPDLVMVNFVIGKQTRTNVTIAYIDKIVNENVLKRLKDKLAKIDTDSILDSGYIDQYIEDNPYNPIATVGSTQKPDKLAGMILEGRIAIFCDCTPHVLYVPTLFIENLQVQEDYYSRVIISSILRFIRLMALLISILLPGFFISLVTYNQEMIPEVFLITLVSARSKIPLPAGAEMFFMLVMFELLRESGTRLPRPIGSAISIVGALIIGETAVSAGIVGAPAVIILGLTAVCSFIIPSLTEFMILYRFFFLFLGGVMGLIGISAGVVIMLTHLVSTSSLGVPILSAFSKEELRDTIPRQPLRNMVYRPDEISGENRIRRRR